MKVAIIKYNAGNVQSVIYALNRLGVDPVVTDREEELRAADKVIFPGVGEASSAMKSLREKKLDKLIPKLRQPVLGICVGLQLLCTHSEENNTEGLNIFPVQVKRFPIGQKVPQIGWNNLQKLSGTLFKGLEAEPFVYFVHSYYAEPGNDTVALCTYNALFSAALERDNFFAVQFHTEKSGPVGEKILKNFIELEWK